MKFFNFAYITYPDKDGNRKYGAYFIAAEDFEKAIRFFESSIPNFYSYEVVEVTQFIYLNLQRGKLNV